MFKLCVSLGTSCDHCLNVLPGLDSRTEMAEIRVDLLSDWADPVKVESIFTQASSLKIDTIATCRDLPEPGFTPQRLAVLKACIKAGATYCDLEVEAPASYQEAVLAECRAQRVELIVSHHNYSKTESASLKLDAVLAECLAKGADVAKVAVAVESARGAARVLALYNAELAEGKRVVALGMGAHGRVTRVAAGSLGAPFTFCAMDEGSLTAPGQLTRESMRAVMRELGVEGFAGRHEAKQRRVS